MITTSRMKRTVKKELQPSKKSSTASPRHLQPEKRFDLKTLYDSCEQEITYDNIRRRSDLKFFSKEFPKRKPIYIESVSYTHLKYFTCYFCFLFFKYAE